MEILQQIQSDCLYESATTAETAFKALETLLDLHRQNLPGTGEFYPALENFRLNAAQLAQLNWFLHFVLLGTPHRSIPASRCMVKLYNAENEESVCRLIEIYRHTCDATTCHLTDVITHSRGFENFSERVIALFRQLHAEGLPETRKIMGAKFKYYKHFYGFSY